MTVQTLKCYVLPARPLPMLLPIECVAEVVEQPEFEVIEKASAAWMKGHIVWNFQRLSILSYEALLGIKETDEKQESMESLVVLNPIPKAARKAYAGLLCYGEIQQISIDQGLITVDTPEGVDRRYIEATVEASDQRFFIPRLVALGVAFSYF